MSESLTVAVRDARGKRNAKRLRREGLVPAILYGHGEACLSLSCKAEQVASVIRHGGRVVDLAGAVQEKALIRDLQWDTYGLEVLHLDLTRVSADERLRIKVSIELKGQARGAKDGGVVEQIGHDLEIECLATAIPEKLIVSLNDLGLNQSILAKDVPLPEGIKLLSDPDELVVHCVPPMTEAEAEVGEVGAAEPEIIGRKAQEEGEGEEG